jgi:hypothetical protein
MSKEVALGLANQIQTRTIKFGQIWTRWKNPFKNTLVCVALYKPAFLCGPVQTGQAGFVCPNPIDLKLDPNSPDLIETSTLQLGKFSY